MSDIIREGRLFFVDSENGFERLIEGCENLDPNDHIVVFYRGHVSKQAHMSLEFSPAKVEWITCVDPGVKNSMDFQLVAELALRLALSDFAEGYVVSCDKGFNPAIHYLKQCSAARGTELLLVSNISHAVAHRVTRTLRQLERLTSREEIEQAFALLLGERGAAKVVNGMAEVLIKESLAHADHLEETCVIAQGVDGPAAVEASVQEAPAESHEEHDESGEEADVQVTLSGAEQETLADLKGLGKALSKKLKEAGISTPNQLRAMGSVEAWRRIREVDPSFSMRWLYMFEVAITGGALGDIAAERKRQLKREAKRVS